MEGPDYWGCAFCPDFKNLHKQTMREQFGSREYLVEQLTKHDKEYHKGKPTGSLGWLTRAAPTCISHDMIQQFGPVKQDEFGKAVMLSVMHERVTWDPSSGTITVELDDCVVDTFSVW